MSDIEAAGSWKAIGLNVINEYGVVVATASDPSHVARIASLNNADKAAAFYKSHEEGMLRLRLATVFDAAKVGSVVLVTSTKSQGELLLNEWERFMGEKLHKHRCGVRLVTPYAIDNGHLRGLTDIRLMVLMLRSINGVELVTKSTRWLEELTRLAHISQCEVITDQAILEPCMIGRYR